MEKGRRLCGNHLTEMSDRELGRRRREILLRRARRRKAAAVSLAMLAAVGIIMACALSYRTIRSSAVSGFKYYTGVTVGAGDTLWELADLYIDYEHYESKNSYIKEVRHINHLDESCSIAEGQILILPYYSCEYR